MARVNVSVDQTVFDKVTSEVQREERTLFAFTNEWLSLAAELSVDGWSASKIRGLCGSISLLKEMDVITLPSDFVDELISREYKTDKEGLLEMFRNMGNNLVGLLKIATPDLDSLSVVARNFLMLLPVKQFEIRKGRDNSLEVDIVGVGRKIESAECTFEFMEAILNGYGYSVSKHESGVGMLRMWAYNNDSTLSEGVVDYASIRK